MITQLVGRGIGMAREVSVLLDGMSYLECPRWHEDRLWFSDFYRHEVLSAAEDGSDLQVEAIIPHQPAGIGWLPDGRLLVASMRNRMLLRVESDGALERHADLSPYATGHLNDLVVDNAGRAYVGNFGFDLMAGAPIEPADLLRVHPDGSVTRVAGQLWFPNGSVITDDNVLLVCETFGNRITAFDIAPDGSLTDRRAWARFGPLPSSRDLAAALPEAVVAPDGCTFDAEGALWVADGANGRVVRVREGGTIVEQITPGTGTFACALGGADGRTLYICAAPDFAEQARSTTREAQLLAVRVDVPHAGLP